MDELLTRKEFHEGMKLIMSRLYEIQGKSPRFITRKEIIADHSLRWYENMRKSIPPIKQGGKCSTVKHERKVYERYLIILLLWTNY